MEEHDKIQSEEEIINDVLVNLFHDILDIEQKAIITEEFRDISGNDMHIIEAIGIEEPQNMSAVAQRLSVTMGTLSTSVNQLVKKGYVIRERSETDRRVVYTRLTEKGIKAYRHHEAFHRTMLEAGLKGLSPAEKQQLAGLLERLRRFFMEYKGGSLYGMEERGTSYLRGR